MADQRLGKELITVEELREIDLVSYFGRHNFLPAKMLGNNYWYFSPFREETTPSFKVNRRKNIWVDYGEYKDNGKFLGGSIIDFGMKVHNCGVFDFRQHYQADTPISIQKHSKIKVLPKESEDSNYILSEKELSYYPLLNYLFSRNIDLETARKYCKEVRYEHRDNEYYAIGFKNDISGYELRNQHYKTSTIPKGITTIHNSDKNKEVLVFEGFFDFLSFMSIHKDKDLESKNYVILNSAVFFNRAKEYLQKHERIRMYSDNDATGKKWIQYVDKEQLPKYIDESHNYHPFKDLNAWHSNKIIPAGKLVEMRQSRHAIAK